MQDSHSSNTFSAPVPRVNGGTSVGASTSARLSVVRRRLLEGAGVAVLPRRSVASDLADGTLTELMPTTIIEREDISLVWRLGHPFEDEIRQLASELRGFPLNG